MRRSSHPSQQFKVDTSLRQRHNALFGDVSTFFVKKTVLSKKNKTICERLQKYKNFKY